MARTRKRTIHVDGVEYGWAVRRTDPGHVALRIWPVPGRSGCRLEVQVAFDDPWLNFGPIITAPAERVAEVFALTPVTPQQVAELIRAALASGWRVDDGESLRFVRDRGRLEPVPGHPAG
ncbi:hypothetical protein [Micromonospora auratinigra]|uniref:Uncharacterized protein n=1 Tax=Micromonospora auratinigra TaxID=261654 RepID=A0A1A8ZI11_9ACTN|nr:hypothetical protein [Micromonospora auratinigra]SBT43510.1 hypothetical protein GA0070611_2346 [Micromonospora auratinigra]